MISTREFPDLENLTALINSSEINLEKKQALELYRSAILQDGSVRVEHVSSDGGRYRSFAKKGSREITVTGKSLPKDIRAALFGKQYDDLDMVNASGSILYQLFSKEGHHVPLIEHYCLNREEVLQDIMTFYDPPLDRDTAKTMVIEVFYGGDGKKSLAIAAEQSGIQTERKLPGFLIELRSEYRSSIEVIMEQSGSDHWHKYYSVYCKAKKSCSEKGRKLWYGSFAGFLCQKVERSILDVIISEIKDLASRARVFDPVGPLIHDGLLVKKSIGVAGHLERISEQIKSVTGYNIDLLIKPMNFDRSLVQSVEDAREEEREEVAGEDAGAAIDLTSYESLKAEFEKTRFKIRRGCRPFYTIYPDCNEIEAYSEKNFIALNRDWIPKGGYKFLKRWLDDGTKRKYDRVDFSCVSEDKQSATVYYAYPAVFCDSSAPAKA